MIKRWGNFAIAYALLMLPAMYLVINSPPEEQQWRLIAGGVWFLILAMAGNWYVFFGTRFDMPTFWKWLLLNTFALGMVAIGYLNIIGVQQFP